MLEYLIALLNFNHLGVNGGYGSNGEFISSLHLISSVSFSTSTKSDKTNINMKFFFYVFFHALQAVTVSLNQMVSHFD